MYKDRHLQFSSAQALTATAVSTDIHDCGADRDIGVGKNLCAVVSFKTALGGTSPTYQFKIQSATDAAFTTPIDEFVSPLFGTGGIAVAANTAVQYQFPPTNKRYVRFQHIMGGTSPTLTVDANIVLEEDLPQPYPSGYGLAV